MLGLGLRVMLGLGALLGLVDNEVPSKVESEVGIKFQVKLEYVYKIIHFFLTGG